MEHPANELKSVDKFSVKKVYKPNGISVLTESKRCMKYTKGGLNPPLASCHSHKLLTLTANKPKLLYHSHDIRCF